MWPVFIVPNNEQTQLLAELVAIQRDEYSTQAFLLHSSDETFNDSDTAMLADRSEAGPNVLATTPCF